MYEYLIILILIMIGFTICIFNIHFFIEKWIYLCSNCKTMKLEHFKVKHEILCKKCGTPMDQIEIPEDLIKMRVKYVQIAMVLLFPIFISLIFFIIFGSFIFMYLMIGMVIVTSIVTVILFLLSRKRIFQRAIKLS